MPPHAASRHPCPVYAGIGAAEVTNLTSTLGAVILQNLLPLTYSAQALVAAGPVASILGLYLGKNLSVVASTSPTNASQVWTSNRTCLSSVPGSV